MHSTSYQDCKNSPSYIRDIVLTDEVLAEKERYKAITSELDSTFTEILGY